MAVLLFADKLQTVGEVIVRVNRCSVHRTEFLSALGNSHKLISEKHIKCPKGWRKTRMSRHHLRLMIQNLGSVLWSLLPALSIVSDYLFMSLSGRNQFSLLTMPWRQIQFELRRIDEIRVSMLPFRVSRHPQCCIIQQLQLLYQVRLVAMFAIWACKAINGEHVALFLAVTSMLARAMMRRGREKVVRKTRAQI